MFLCPTVRYLTSIGGTWSDSLATCWGSEPKNKGNNPFPGGHVKINVNNPISGRHVKINVNIRFLVVMSKYNKLSASHWENVEDRTIARAARKKQIKYSQFELMYRCTTRKKNK